MRWIVLTSISATWCVSLLLPAVSVGESVSISGWQALGKGWRGATMDIYAWYANPLFLLAVAMSAVRSTDVAAVLSGSALLLGLTSFAAGERAAAAGFPAADLSLQAGFFVWLLALSALTISCWFAVYRSIRRGQE